MTDHVRIGDWCTLYHADSAEIIDELRALNPDAVIMDPPYGIGLHKAGFGAGEGRVGIRKDGSSMGLIRFAAAHGGDRIVGDDGSVSLQPWFEFPVVLLWGADHLRRQLPDGGRFIAWDKIGQREAYDDFSDVEFGWHSRKGKATKIFHRWKGIIRDKSGGDTAPRVHPTQKPIRVMEWCIEQCRLEPGALILDPYMGSGTTAIAAFKKRMKFIGVEIDRRWFDVAVERIKRQTSDGPLFDDESAGEQPCVTPQLLPPRQS